MDLTSDVIYSDECRPPLALFDRSSTRLDSIFLGYLHHPRRREPRQRMRKLAFLQLLPLKSFFFTRVAASPAARESRLETPPRQSKLLAPESIRLRIPSKRSNAVFLRENEPMIAPWTKIEKKVKKRTTDGISTANRIRVKERERRWCRGSNFVVR